MKNRIVQHIPPFVDGVPKKEVEFDTLEELLEISWIKQWSQAEEFDKFSISNRDSLTLLMVEFTHKQEHQWYVLGYLLHDIPEMDRIKYPEDENAG